MLYFQDCFRDAARELAESPEVGIIQHESGTYSPLTSACEMFMTRLLARRNASCTSLLREWYCALYTADQQIHLYWVCERRSRSFCGAQRLSALVGSPGRSIYRSCRWEEEDLVRVECL